MRTVDIGSRTVGGGAPVLVIGEAGSNHNGSFEQAVGLIRIAAGAGVDAVKFQLFRAATLYPKSAGKSEYLNLDRSIYDIIASLELPPDWLPELAGVAHEVGLLFLCSVMDEEGVELLEPHVDAFKIASYELTHLPLLAAVACTQKPLILSTGAANLDEISESVAVVRENGDPPLVLLQCTASYPAPIDALNIAAIGALKEAFGVPVGLSDHSRDPIVAPVAAVGAGADSIEKHFTFSNAADGPDHPYAVEPDELAAMVSRIRLAEAALGSPRKVVVDVEQELRAFARRAIFAVQPIRVGEELTRENTRVLRKGVHDGGFVPREYPSILGRRAKRPIASDALLRPEDVE